MRRPRADQGFRNVGEFLLKAEHGEQALEFLFLLAFIVIPALWVILFLESVLREYVDVATLFLTSPFF